MELPTLADTIVAVSSGWAPSSLAIVRLSGSGAFHLAAVLGVAPPGPDARGRGWTEGRAELGGHMRLPVTAFWFRQPRSYTGQDVVELHTVGCPPLLRELCRRLIELGARRALPGEFTARAFAMGKLSVAEVEGVLATMRADSDAELRAAGRSARAQRGRAIDELSAGVADLLALVEAGIDFVDEEDIRLITGDQVCTVLDGLLSLIAGLCEGEGRVSCADRPHVALVGLPNAGKSTLFNALVGYERAIVSPVLGTTRDVLSAEIEVDGLIIVLQDCAGLGAGEAELELAAHLLAERTEEQADLVLWVHAVDTPWTEAEVRAAARVPRARRLLVWTKEDLPASVAVAPATLEFDEACRVSAASGRGVAALHATLCRRLARVVGSFGAGMHLDEALMGARADLQRARAVAGVGGVELREPELLAVELRAAYERLRGSEASSAADEILRRVFAQFCVGK